MYFFYPDPFLPKLSSEASLVFAKEVADGRRTLCSSLVLDAGPDELTSRVSTHLYNACRAGTININGFPDFQPLLSALQTGSVSDEPSRDFQVCKQIGDNLYILEALAKKWLQCDLKDRAIDLIREHNKTFGGGDESDFLHSEEGRRILGCFV